MLRKSDLTDIVSMCALCMNSDVEQARLGAAKWWKAVGGYDARDTLDKYLDIPLSEDGTGPATHWLCYNNNISRELVDHAIWTCTPEAWNLPIIVEMSHLSSFLSKHGLKIIGDDIKSIHELKELASISKHNRRERLRQNLRD